MKKFLLMSVGVLCVLFLFAGTPSAMNLSFDQIVDGGTLSYDGIGGPLEGRDISFQTVVGNSTPDHATVVLNITNGFLNFDTGPLITPGPNYAWAGGGFFTLTGSIAAQGDFGGIGQGVILGGTFSAAGGLLNFVFGAEGIDTKNPDLLEYYGLADIPFNFTNTEIATRTFSPSGDGSFTAVVTEADIVNSPVPEPATMLLTGLGLFGMGFYLRRRFKKA